MGKILCQYRSAKKILMERISGTSKITLHVLLIFVCSATACSHPPFWLPFLKSQDQDEGTPNTSGQTKIGRASFYGSNDGFGGKKTASGETFDPRKLTAAHRTLPFGTDVLVENLENGKQVTVRINDRGPWEKSRIIDLSYAAAQKLDIVADGEQKVSLTVLR